MPSQTSSNRQARESSLARRISSWMSGSRTIISMGRPFLSERIGSSRRVRRDDAGQFEVAAAAGALEHLVLGLGGLRQAVDLDEALGGGGVVLVTFLVGGQLVAVEAVLALAADDHGVPLEQLHAGDAGDVL